MFGVKNFSLVTFFSLMILFPKIFGFAIFEYPASKFKISIIGVIMFLVNSIATLAQVHYLFGQLNYVFTSMPEQSALKIFFVSLFVTMLLTLLTKTFISIMNCVFSKRIFQIIKDIEMLNDEVSWCFFRLEFLNISFILVDEKIRNLQWWVQWFFAYNIFTLC